MTGRLAGHKERMEVFQRPPRVATAKTVDPIDGLRAVVAMRRDLNTVEARHVDNALQAGHSWSEIAGALGVSKQAAHKRHAQRNREQGQVATVSLDRALFMANKSP